MKSAGAGSNFEVQLAMAARRHLRSPQTNAVPGAGVLAPFQPESEMVEVIPMVASLLAVG